MLEKLAKVIASVFFIGYIPYAPGTCGSLFGLLILFILNPTATVQAFLVVGVLIIGTWASYKGERLWGKDDKKIVVDEFVGMLITVFLIPTSTLNLFLGFVLFRFYDIIKPFPIRHIEKKLQNGLGVMLDDVVAGIMANITLRIIISMT